MPLRRFLRGQLPIFLTHAEESLLQSTQFLAGFQSTPICRCKPLLGPSLRNANPALRVNCWNAGPYCMHQIVHYLSLWQHNYVIYLWSFLNCLRLLRPIFRTELASPSNCFPPRQKKVYLHYSSICRNLSNFVQILSPVPMELADPHKIELWI